MILTREFYNRYTPKVARDLLGCFLVREYQGKIIRAMIVETEAYRGEHDLACHASKGRTARTETLYAEPGTVYVYLIYGMYYMLNVVTEQQDYPAAVLVRGLANAHEDGVNNTNFIDKKLDGPGKLTRYLHIDKSLNGLDMTNGKKLWIESSAKGLNPYAASAGKIIVSPRIGIDYAKHARHWKWNFKLQSAKDGIIDKY